MRRREFITLLGGAAAWPVAARAQEGGRVRRSGALAGIGDDERARARQAVFVQSLAQVGWIDGSNVRIDYRWGGGDIDKIRKHATELAADAGSASRMLTGRSATMRDASLRANGPVTSLFSNQRGLIL